MPKRLVVLLDGTWARADRRGHSSNVVALMRCLAPEDAAGVQQVLYYDRGVGTGDLPDRLWGGLTGSGLEDNVKDAYMFLGNNFEAGDEIYLFGFSRGAFTARSLAGFVHACGLLDRESMGRIHDAWDLYRTKPRKRNPAELAAVRGRDVDIQCVGVWDTVGALGIPMRWFNPFRFLTPRFHDTQLSDKVRRAFHALAIDERRGPFKPTLWEKNAGAPLPDGQVVEQVWFAGAHTDVGGGYYASASPDCAYGIHQFPLRWMADRVRATTPLAFKDGEVERLTAAASETAPQHESRTLLYATSWLLPLQRVIGGQDGWTRRLLPSRTRPRRGNEFVNEAIHASALRRLGNPVAVRLGPLGWKQDYAPRNLEAAKTAVPPVDDA